MESTDDGEDGGPLGKGPGAGDVAAGDGDVLGVALARPSLDLGDGVQRVGLGAMVGEEHLQHLLKLENRPVAGGAEPLAEGPATLRGDRVDGPRTASDRL